MRAADVSRALKKYEALVLHEYGLTLSQVLSESDAVIRNKRLWRLTGVVLKKRYATPVLRRPTLGVKARYRYEINRRQLRDTLSRRTWEAKILAQLPGRKRKESLEAFVIRIKTETNHGKRIREMLCRFVCPGGELQHILVKLGANPGKVGAVLLAIPALVTALEAAAKVVPNFPLKDPLMGVALLVALGIEGTRKLCEKWDRASNPALTDS